MGKLPLSADPPTLSQLQAIENKGNGRIWEQWEGSLQPQYSGRAGAHMEVTNNPPNPPTCSQAKSNQWLSEWELRFCHSQTLTNDLVEDLLERVEGEELHLVLECITDFVDELRTGLQRIRTMELD